MILTRFFPLLIFAMLTACGSDSSNDSNNSSNNSDNLSQTTEPQLKTAKNSDELLDYVKTTLKTQKNFYYGVDGTSSRS